MRPTPIRWFEGLLLSAVALGLVNAALSWDAAVAELALEPSFARAAPLILAGAIAVLVLIYLALWYLAARRASRVAKWIFVALVAINVGLMAWQLSAGPIATDPNAVLGMIELGLMIAAAVLLFHPDASAWFAGRGRPADQQPD